MASARADAGQKAPGAAVAITVRRRVARKVSAEEAFRFVTKEEVRVSEAPEPMAASPTFTSTSTTAGEGTAIDERSPGAVSSSSTARAGAGEAYGREALGEVDGSEAGEVLPVEPGDATTWWCEAAERWPAIIAALRAEAALRIARISSSPVAVGSRKRTAEEQDPPYDADGETAIKRPPATPLASAQVETSMRSPEVTALKSVTPKTSPPSMRLNSRGETCKICCNETPAFRTVRLGCRHGWYCAQCMLKHAEARLDLGAPSITCPECCSLIPERHLRKLLPQELIERLLARSLEQAVSSVADLRACPTPNCPMRVALEPGAAPRFRCNLCRKDSCLQCGSQPYHKGLTCEEHAERRRARGKQQQEDEDRLRQWLQETGTKQCPTCRMGVTKQNLHNQHTQYSECHKMCCRNCGTRFCFKCLSVLTDTFTCGCTIDAHGFIDPFTGKRLNHLRRGRGKPAKQKAHG